MRCSSVGQSATVTPTATTSTEAAITAPRPRVDDASFIRGVSPESPKLTLQRWSRGARGAACAGWLWRVRRRRWGRRARRDRPRGRLRRARRAGEALTSARAATVASARARTKSRTTLRTRTPGSSASNQARSAAASPGELVERGPHDVAAGADERTARRRFPRARCARAALVELQLGRREAVPGPPLTTRRTPPAEIAPETSASMTARALTADGVGPDEDDGQLVGRARNAPRDRRTRACSRRPRRPSCDRGSCGRRACP